MHIWTHAFDHKVHKLYANFKYGMEKQANMWPSSLMHLCKQEIQSISYCPHRRENDVRERRGRQLERKNIVHRGVQWPLGSKRTGNGAGVQRKWFSPTGLSLSLLTYNADIVLVLTFFFLSSFLLTPLTLGVSFFLGLGFSVIQPLLSFIVVYPNGAEEWIDISHGFWHIEEPVTWLLFKVFQILQKWVEHTPRVWVVFW